MKIEPCGYTQPSQLLCVKDGWIGEFWRKRDEQEHREFIDDASMPDDIALYTEADLAEAIKRARNEALEEAAKWHDAKETFYDKMSTQVQPGSEPNFYYINQSSCHTDSAMVIRGMKEP